MLCLLRSGLRVGREGFPPCFFVWVAKLQGRFHIIDGSGDEFSLPSVRTVDDLFGTDEIHTGFFPAESSTGDRLEQAVDVWGRNSASEPSHVDFNHAVGAAWNSLPIAVVEPGLQTILRVEGSRFPTALKDIGCPVIDKIQYLRLCVLPHGVTLWCNWRFNSPITCPFKSCAFQILTHDNWQRLRPIGVSEKLPRIELDFVIAALDLDNLVINLLSSDRIFLLCTWCDKTTTSCLVRKSTTPF